MLSLKSAIDKEEEARIREEKTGVLKAVKLLSVMSKPRKSLKQFEELLKWLRKGSGGFELFMTISPQLGEHFSAANLFVILT